MADFDNSFSSHAKEERVALVNPTRFPVSPMGNGRQLDMNPGQLDGKFSCIQILDKTTADACHKNRKHFLEKWPVEEARIVYDRAKEMGGGPHDFFRAMKERTGSERPSTEAMFFEIKVREDLRAELADNGVHIQDSQFDDVDTDTLKRWLKDPMAWRNETLRKSHPAALPEEEEPESVEDVLDAPMDVSAADRKTLWDIAKTMELPDIAKNIKTEDLRARVAEKAEAGL